MPAIFSSAPGKIILFGEHAVVYDQPAIATPTSEIRCKAYIFPIIDEGHTHIIEAPDIGLNVNLQDLEENHPLAFVVSRFMEEFNLDHLPSFHLKIVSTIPVASGMGSSAATTISIIRALGKFIGQDLSNELVNQIALDVEKIQHGTPSGVDNTVITYEEPIFFQINTEHQILQINKDIFFIIADSGKNSKTKEIVNDVRERWLKNRNHLNELFVQIGEISKNARGFLEIGDNIKIGELLTRNQKLLKSLGVSCEELDTLIEAALDAGAFGAKLCGAGRGGLMVALINQDDYSHVEKALKKVGAKSTFHLKIKKSDNRK